MTTSLSNAATTFEQLNRENTQISPIVGPVTQYDENIVDVILRPSIDVAPPPLPQPPNAMMPSFHEVISACVYTVPEVLMEWVNGLCGSPSISSVEAQWGTKWRVGSQNQKMFSRRKIILSVIERYAERKRLSKDAAAWAIEEKRIEKKRSIVYIADNWKAFELVDLK
jgi:hypothetical protein